MKKKILIVIANYYRDISKQLLNSALGELKKNSKVNIIEVPGVFEIPVTIIKNINKYDGVLALGCVIKGETPHFDFISSATTDAIMKISVDKKKPVGNGIITCLNKNQANARGKKGKEAANAIMSVLFQKK
ncbi:MAG: 6,7-dimethyl-8-ribityllumazine synthase [Candidatus Pelagibacter sp.]|jgi:6,7-dimethyl-8-ribityllumazine synthase|nr:6,7-dimethyl-8-ribityllumazine synthase [Candidatus Pelagibacter sp.]|tara:strand:- start:320 stop:712 length:393 start_codon:yes stop_codon:yes gene_type:complete